MPHRLDLSENPASRAEGLSIAENLRQMKWLEKMTVMHDVTQSPLPRPRTR